MQKTTGCQARGYFVWKYLVVVYILILLYTECQALVIKTFSTICVAFCRQS